MDKKDLAKQVKIETLYTGNLIKIGDRLRGACPFHQDTKNPNFFIFLKTNTWFCFQEKQGGDAISFIMKSQKIDFKEAIQLLTKKK